MNTNRREIHEYRAAVQVGAEVDEAARTVHAGTIAKRLAAATRGPWVDVDLRHQRGGQIRILSRAPGCYGIIANVLRSGPRAAADAELIANAPADVQWLLEELERVRAQRDVLLAGTSTGDGTWLAYHQLRADQRKQESDRGRRCRSCGRSGGELTENGCPACGPAADIH